LRGSHPSWAAPANRVAATPDASEVVFRVYLHGRDDTAMERAAAAVSDPASPQYHRFLSTQEVRAQFAPADATVDRVEQWLTANGLQVLGVPANKMYVEAGGSAARVAKTFGVQLSDYRVRGKVLRAADRELSIPTNLASTIASVIGVDQSLALLRPSKPAPPEAGFRNAPPCSSYWSEKVDTTDPPYGGGFARHLPYAPCGYKPGQLRAAYGMAATVDAGHTGAGTTVAIIDAFASPTIFSDASTYAARNDPAHPLLASQFSQKIYPPTTRLQGPNQCDASGWYGEETLDVEAVHAMAPGAHIHYVGASDCLDASLDKALNDIVADHSAQIVSNSYGDLGEDVELTEVVAFELIVQQAALEGIGVYFSSGDDGDEVATLGHAAADFPASSPFVTAVGGTSLGVAADGSVALETGWETGISALSGGAYAPPAPGEFLYGSGGGTSVLFTQPDYQKGVVPRSYAVANGKTPARVVPDLSVVGDPNTGMLIGETQKFPGKEGVHYDEYRVGGTSLSCPLLAGIVALADDLAGAPHGFINPSLYSKVRTAKGLRDIKHVRGADVRVDYVNGVDAKKGTSTSVRTFDLPGLAIATKPGYDTTTGLGAPVGSVFLRNL
jgi:subtilase family serine protease